jgi:CRP-like cAMP-binding protein
MPGLDGKTKKHISDRLASVDALQLYYNEHYLKRVLKSCLSESHFVSIPGFFDYRGILQLTYIGNLTTGMSFGEKGLDERILRTATIICDTPCHFGVIYKDDYDQILKQVSIFQAETQRRFFYDEVFCRNVPAAISDKLSYDFNKFSLQVAAKSIVFRQESNVDYVYVVEKGSVLIYRSESVCQPKTELTISSKQQKVHKLALLTRGGIFGMEDFFKKSNTRYYSSVALSPCKLLRISKECFTMHLNNHSELRGYIQPKCKIIAEHRRHLMETQGSLDLPSVDNKATRHDSHDTQAVRQAITTMMTSTALVDVHADSRVCQYREASTATAEIDTGCKTPKNKCADIRRLFRKARDSDMSKFAKLSLYLTREKVHTGEDIIEKDLRSTKNRVSDSVALSEWQQTLVRDKTFVLKRHLERMQRWDIRDIQGEKLKLAYSERTSGLKLSESFLAKCKEKALQRSHLNLSVDNENCRFSVRRLSNIEDERRTTSLMRESKPSFYLDLRCIKKNDDYEKSDLQLSVTKDHFTPKKLPISSRPSMLRQSANRITSGYSSINNNRPTRFYSKSARRAAMK